MTGSYTYSFDDICDRPVAVVGAGTLGRRIALMFATRGGTVRIYVTRAVTRRGRGIGTDRLDVELGCLPVTGTAPPSCNRKPGRPARLVYRVVEAHLTRWPERGTGP